MKNSKIQNGRHFLKIGMTTLQIPCASKIPSKSLYLARFRDISIFVFCNFCEKFEKFKMAAIFGETKFFLKIGMVALQGYPVGQKFRQKMLYLARFSRYKHFCVFLVWKIPRPFLNQTMPKSNDFQILIE